MVHTPRSLNRHAVLCSQITTPSDIIISTKIAKLYEISNVLILRKFDACGFFYIFKASWYLIVVEHAVLSRSLSVYSRQSKTGRMNEYRNKQTNANNLNIGTRNAPNKTWTNSCDRVVRHNLQWITTHCCWLFSVFVLPQHLN